MQILDKIEFWLPFVEIQIYRVITQIKIQSIEANEIRVKILFNIKQDPLDTI